MLPLPDHYAVLGISPSADEEVISAAYRALAKKFHPDTGTQRGSASAERFRDVQDAWETLGDRERRRRYDAMRRGLTRPGEDRHGASPPPAHHRTVVPGTRTVISAAKREPSLKGPDRNTVLPNGKLPAGALPGPTRQAPAKSRPQRGAFVPLAAIAGLLVVLGSGALWLVSGAGQDQTVETATESLPAAVPQSAAAVTTASTSPPAVEAAAAAVESAPDEAPPSVQATPVSLRAETLFALSILPLSRTLASPETEPGNLMFSSRIKCEEFGAAAIERRRAAARLKNAALPEERFQCSEITASAP